MSAIVSTVSPRPALTNKALSCGGVDVKSANVDWGRGRSLMHLHSTKLRYSDEVMGLLAYWKHLSSQSADRLERDGRLLTVAHNIALAQELVQRLFLSGEVFLRDNTFGISSAIKVKAANPPGLPISSARNDTSTECRRESRDLAGNMSIGNNA